MEKRLIATMVAAAFAGTAGVAVAGPISVASIGTYASEVIGAADGPIVVGNVTYTLSNPFAPNSTQSVKYTLSAKVADCPSLSITDALNPTTPIVIGVGTKSTTVVGLCSYTVSTVNPIASQSLLNFTGAAADKSAGKALAAGTPLTATVAVFDSTGAAVPGESNTAQVAVAAQALSAAWKSSSAFDATDPTLNERSKVDVAIAKPATKFTNTSTDVTSPSTTTINLGSFTLKENSGAYKDANGDAVTIGRLATNDWTLTVTGPFSSDSKGVGNVFLASTPGCAAIPDGEFELVGTTATLTAFDATGITIDEGGFQTAYVCYSPNVDGAVADVQISTGQFAGSAATKATLTMVEGTLPMEGETASGNLYRLDSNGAVIDVRVMTTAATTGWTTVLRVINTGAVTSDVTATYLNADGTPGATGVIISGLKAGATAMISSADVEKALGVSLSATGNPPRLRLSAPTDSLRAQAWVQTPNGAWFMGTPGQEAEATGNPPSYK